MAQSERSKRKETVIAQVFLRSVSGRSVHEIAEGPLPADLTPFRASESARTAVYRLFERLGFKVYLDEMGLALTIEASPKLFSKVFGLSETDIAKISASEVKRLRAPREFAEFVEEIVLTPKPEFF